jgi:hypothetical protein
LKRFLKRKKRPLKNLVETKLVFISTTASLKKEEQATKEEDALGASLRYLKYKRWQQ